LRTDRIAATLECTRPLGAQALTADDCDHSQPQVCHIYAALLYNRPAAQFP